MFIDKKFERINFVYTLFKVISSIPQADFWENFHAPSQYSPLRGSIYFMTAPLGLHVIVLWSKDYMFLYFQD